MTAAQVAVLYPRFAEIFDMVAGVSIARGQICYVNSSGKLDLADANGSGTLQPVGMALNPAGAGQAVSILKTGFVAGFTISSLAYDALVYLSNTAGALADAGGGSSIIMGRIKPLSDSTYTKALYFSASWLTLYT